MACPKHPPIYAYSKYTLYVRLYTQYWICSNPRRFSPQMEVLIKQSMNSGNVWLGLLICFDPSPTMLVRTRCKKIGLSVPMGMGENHCTNVYNTLHALTYFLLIIGQIYIG